jgi:hypothetical protein
MALHLPYTTICITRVSALEKSLGIILATWLFWMIKLTSTELKWFTQKSQTCEDYIGIL